MTRRSTYTISEAADILGIAPSTANERVRRGELPALWFGRRIVITRHGLEAIIGPLDNTDPSSITHDPRPIAPITADRSAIPDDCTTEHRNDRHRLATSPKGKQRNHRRTHRSPAGRSVGGGPGPTVA